MQPYIFPYLGYYQLVQAVDHFVLFDDVQFIRRGWINRNAILLNGARHSFTIPLKKPSQHKLILETERGEEYEKWRTKFLRTLTQHYGKAPCFTTAFELIGDVLACREKEISAIAAQSIRAVAAYAGCQTTFSVSSGLSYERALKGQEKILALCNYMEAKEYINLPGGSALYSAERFEKERIGLGFIKPEEIAYRQWEGPYVPHLSIIDALMFNTADKLKELLNRHTINFKTLANEKPESNHLWRRPARQPGPFLPETRQSTRSGRVYSRWGLQKK